MPPQNPGNNSTPKQNTITKFDPNKVAADYLKHSAEIASTVMYPIAQLVPDGAVGLNQQTFPAGTSPSINLTWPTDGLLVSIAATTEDGSNASMASCLLQVLVDGQYNLISSGAGQGTGYIPFAQVSGQNSTLGVWRVKKRFSQATAWSVFVLNTTGAPIVGDLRFDYVDLRGGRV